MIRRMLIGLAWGVLLLLALLVVAYAGFVLVTGAFPAPLRPSFQIHQMAITAHIVGGMLALALAPLQLVPWLLRHRPVVHRWLGRVAMLGMLIGGLGGVAMATVAYGGVISRLGFAIMALAWMGTAGFGYRAIRARQIVAHQRWMIRNVALTLAAITLRIWLPLLLAVAHMPFDSAYPLLAWLCWVPNVLVAEALIRSMDRLMDRPMDDRRVPSRQVTH